VKLHSPRVLGLSIAIAASVGTALGVLFAVLGDRQIFYGIGTGLFVAGLGCAATGLLGATEPSEGWASGRRRHPERGRQGMIARIAESETEGKEEIPSWPMAVWGIVVGGVLIALASAAFSLT
jgi:hypothetical protein